MRALFLLLFLTSAAAAQCDFARNADAYTGSCGTVLDETPIFTLRPTRSLPASRWREDAQPKAAWDGTMTNSDGTSPITLEVHADGYAILRTAYGWFGVTNVADGDHLRFDLDTREVTPNALDRRIVERAMAILSSDAVWNRKDNRQCPPDAATWSLYCAMQKATVEVTGAADHRRPGMEAVRLVIEDRTKGRNYDHRLMDYNNDPTTTLADVQSVFREALAGMDDPAWLARHGFAGR